MITALLLTALLAPLDDDTPVARVGDTVFTEADIGYWMVERFAHTHADMFVLEQMILMDAAQQGLTPTQEQLEAKQKAEEQEQIQRYFRGDREAWLAGQERRGIDVEAAAKRRLGELRVELAITALALQDRQITEEHLLDAYERRFGDLPERIAVEVLYFGYYVNLPEDGARPSLSELDRRTLERAQAAHRALVAGAEFQTLRATSDPVDSAFVKDGTIQTWRRNLLGNEVDDALNSLDEPGEVAPLVKVWDGYWIVRLLSRESVSFESLREELLTEALEGDVTSEELNQVRERLRMQYAPRILIR